MIQTQTNIAVIASLLSAVKDSGSSASLRHSSRIG